MPFQHANDIKIGTTHGSVGVNNALNISHSILLMALFHFPNWIAFFIIQSTRKWFIKFSLTPDTQFCSILFTCKARWREEKKFKRAKKLEERNCFTIHYEFFIIWLLFFWCDGERKIDNFELEFKFFSCRKSIFPRCVALSPFTRYSLPTMPLNVWTFIVGIETSPRETRKYFYVLWKILLSNWGYFYGFFFAYAQNGK